MKKGFILLLGIFLVGLVNALPTNVTNDSGTLYVYGCTTLNESGKYYLNQSLSTSESCFNVTTNDVYLDFEGYNITGKQNGYGLKSIFVSNLTVKNGSISNFSNAINFTNTNYSLINNVTFSQGNGGNFTAIYFFSSNNNNITYCNFINNNASYNSGIYISTSNNSFLNYNSFFGNSVIKTTNTLNAGGIIGLTLSSLSIINNTNISGSNVLVTVPTFGSAIFGIHSNALNFVLNNSVFNTRIYNNTVNQTAQMWGGGSLFGLRVASNSNVSNLFIYNNTVETYSEIEGGAAAGLYDAKNNTLNYINITNNTLIPYSFAGGGAMFGIYDTLSAYNKMLNFFLSGNNVILKTTTDHDAGCFGFREVYYSYVENLTVIYNNITFGSSNFYGGGGCLGFDGIQNSIFKNVNAFNNNIEEKGFLGITGENDDSYNNTFINLNATVDQNGIMILDETGSSDQNYLEYRNNFGRIFWFNDSENFQSNLTLFSDLSFGKNIVISENYVYLNSSKFTSDNSINSSANITLYNIPTNADEYTILRNGVGCSTCYNFTNLNAGTVVFNVSSFSNYTILAVNFSEESSSSASSSGSSYSGRTYYTNESFFEEGNVFELKRKDKVVFPVNNSSLIFKIISINTKEIKFDIYTKIKNSFIKINETKEIDVDNNSIIDLELTYLEYGESKGKIKFKYFKKEVLELEQNNTFNISKNTEKETSEKNNFWLIFFSSLGTLLIIIVAIFAYLKFIRK